jgi:superfamily II DNA/RNA helicase
MIQERVLDLMVVSNKTTTDAIVQAETGSGKTLAYLLPILAGVDPSRSCVQAMIVVPTRELGLQVSRVAKRLSTNHQNNTYNENKIMIMSVLQGSQNRRQRAWAWAEPPHIVVGTPEQLANMVSLGGIKRYTNIRYVVVDEVDACLLNNNNLQGKVALASSSSTGLITSGTPLHELLSKYLSPTYNDDENDEMIQKEAHFARVASGNAKNIVSKLQRRPLQPRQTIFCSATIPQHRHFVKQCVQNQWMSQAPVYVTAGPSHSLLIPHQLRHAYVVAPDTSKKLPVLRRLLRKITTGKRHTSSSSALKILIFAEPHRPLEEMAHVIAQDLNRHSEPNTDDASSELNTTTNMRALVSVLRYEDNLSQRAEALNIFSSPETHDDARTTADSLRTGENHHQIVRVLLATDLAARGLDVVGITHVIQFDVATSDIVYVHRAGRTGRLGRSGQVITILAPEQEFVLRRIANQLSLGDDLTCLGRSSSIPNKVSTSPTS